jgi:hypothetical protein
MREPPDPLRLSISVPLDLSPAQARELKDLQRSLSIRQLMGGDCVGEEQTETARRQQAQAADAIDDFWRERAAEQLPGVAEELKAWRAWRDAGGSRMQVRAEFSGPQVFDRD